jgi:hypothetical protein
MLASGFLISGGSVLIWEWPMKRLTVVWCLAFLSIFLSACGGDSVFKELPDSSDKVKIDSFTVYGNDPPMDDREQIVAGINDGTFELELDIDQDFSGIARIWIADQEDINSTDLERLIVRLECGYYPYCIFDLMVDCTYSVTNRVSCSKGNGEYERVITTFPEADLNPLMNGSQADLYIVLIADAPGLKPAKRAVPVTFRID